MQPITEKEAVGAWLFLCCVAFALACIGVSSIVPFIVTVAAPFALAVVVITARAIRKMLS